MLFLVISTPAPTRPSEVREQRKSFWPWVEDKIDRGIARSTTYNGHSAPKLEQAVLDYLGEFSDPKLVKQHLALGQAKEMKQKEVELAGVSRALGDLEGQFLQHLA